MKVKISVSTNKLGSSVSKIIEVDRDDFDDGSGGLDMSALDECMLDELFNVIYWSYEVIEGCK